jgi:hypothetical protein
MVQVKLREDSGAVIVHNNNNVVFLIYIIFFNRRITTISVHKRIKQIDCNEKKNKQKTTK